MLETGRKVPMQTAFPYLIVAVLVMQVGGYHLLYWMCCECAHQIMDRMPRDKWMEYYYVTSLVWFPTRILDTVLNVMTENAVLDNRVSPRARIRDQEKIPLRTLPCDVRNFRRTLVYSGKKKRDPRLAEVFGKLIHA